MKAKRMKQSTAVDPFIANIAQYISESEQTIDEAANDEVMTIDDVIEMLKEQRNEFGGNVPLKIIAGDALKVQPSNIQDVYYDEHEKCCILVDSDQYAKFKLVDDLDF